MSDVITGWFAYALMSMPSVGVVIAAVFLLLAAFLFVRIMNSSENDLEWWHLVSTRAQDGKQYADWNKIGQGGGVVLCMSLPYIYVYSDKMEAVGLAAVLTVGLGYLGGVSSYAAWLRSKRGSVETTVTTETSPSSKTTEKTSQTAPIGGDKQ